jgi:hypothetical protein
LKASDTLRTLLVALLLCFSLETTSAARELSPASEISLLTCGSGEELYSAFGHSAFRVKDSIAGFDLVFNYGTFDFNAPGFYTNFVKGKLNYFLSVCDFDDFMREYEHDERRVEEQTFNLTAEQKQTLFDFLINNSRKENKYYRYDFLFDNCSSRICSALEASFGDKLEYGLYYPKERTTFRKLLYECLEDMPWSKLGIDLLLGARLDKVPESIQYSFLPDYLALILGGGKIEGKPLITRSKTLNPPLVKHPRRLYPYLPLILFSIFALIAMICSIWMRMRIFDFVYFLLIGLFACFLVFMWIGTDHHVTKYNLNLLWALPTHALFAFSILKKSRPRWTAIYFASTAVVSLLILIFWKILPQQLNISLIPLIALSAARAFAIVKTEFQVTKRLNNVR